MKRLVGVFWLSLVWVTLWEALTWPNVLGGLVVSGFVLYLLPPQVKELSVGFRPVAAIKLLLYFLWELIVASLEVVWEVVTPGDGTNPAVVAAQTRSRVPGHVTAVANMISLTPGTLSLDVDTATRTIYIHVLHLQSFEETRAAVRRLEELTLAAFPPKSQSTRPEGSTA